VGNAHKPENTPFTLGGQCPPYSKKNKYIFKDLQQDTTMEDWQQDWAKTVEAAAQGIEKFFQEVSQDLGEATLTLMEFTDEMAEEMGKAVAPALDQLESQLTEWLSPFEGLEAELDAFFYDAQLFDQLSDFTSPTMEPLIDQHPVCEGCRHYHGQVYNGTPFICAMHPYGIVDGGDRCADKELFSGLLLPGSRASEEDW
jgi:hypothetical protein